MNMICILFFLLLKKKVKSLRLLESRSSLSSSCSFNQKKFEVFLSFRGADTRKNFISFLYKELKVKEIRTFLDDHGLERGCQISPKLNQAIKESRIAVIVVSPTYTASVWCLKELVKILKLEKQGSLNVLPIFHGVGPCELRRQNGEVEKHFEKHEKRESIETVKSWRDALTDLANISGYGSKDWEDDSMLVDKVMEYISKILYSATPSIGFNLIGIDEHMKKLYPMLDLDSKQDLQVIGISGTGSTGRSALARHAYEKISHNFEAHCFLQDVRRPVSLHCHKSYLQEEILSKMQAQGLSTEMCPKAIKARVRNKKVLLVANDVDNYEQLDALVDESKWFGPGSRIIITTPNRQLLISSSTVKVYEVELLRCYDVRELSRSEAITQRENQFGFKPSTNLHMNLSGTNHFSTLKDLMRARNYCAQMIESREAKMLDPSTETTTRQQLCAKVKTYLKEKAKAKARRCYSRTVKMLSNH